VDLYGNTFNNNYMNKLIEEQRKNIMLFIRDFVYKMRDSGVDFEEPRRVELEEWAKKLPNKTLTKFIDSEIERLKGMRKTPHDFLGDEDEDEDVIPGLSRYIVTAALKYNQALYDQISHLENIKQELV
jgi:hypothetical protein